MANITTRYNVGDKVFTFDPATFKAREIQIAIVSVWQRETKTEISYYPKKEDSKEADYNTRFEERFCFANQNEMLNYITSK